MGIIEGRTIACTFDLPGAGKPKVKLGVEAVEKGRANNLQKK
jgi:hypothetical protein